MTPGRPVRLTDVVPSADAAALVHPSCRPLVRGLLAVLDDPATGADPARTRHAWVELDLVRPVPTDVTLDVTARLRGTARLGAGDGLWIDVDVSGPEGPVVRSRHVVAGRLDPRPVERGGLPSVPRADRPTVGTVAVAPEALDAYRRAAGDTSSAHAEGAPEPIVPGLLALWSALGAAGLDPTHVEARFPAPLPVAAEATIAVDAGTLAARVGVITVLRARLA
ncbi:MAG TPA: hypothetical protein VK507_19855 [Iamia sp.]|nr:hypothetical protein [Iamia sp.]